MVSFLELVTLVKCHAHGIVCAGLLLIFCDSN